MKKVIKSNFNNVVFITGVGKGLGESMLEYFTKKNIFVYGVTRTKNDLSKFNNLKNCKIFFGDVRNIKLIYKIFNQSKKDGNYIKAVINNAGIRQRAKISQISQKDIKKIFDINFFSIFEIMKFFLQYSLKNNLKTSIINIGSIVVMTGFSELCGYASTKGALKSLTQSFAVENARNNVRANMINPGFFKTSYFNKFKKNKKLYNWTISRIPLKRWGNPSEICNIVDFLASDKSSYITGENINVDGGWLNS